ncbi:hypothetical protein J6590_015739 [Homalodisca vitripennis]|nr:hypothetical protein J6590_015739 [Homalodisca vitripennis]
MSSNHNATYHRRSTTLSSTIKPSPGSSHPLLLPGGEGRSLLPDQTLTSLQLLTLRDPKRSPCDSDDPVNHRTLLPPPLISDTDKTGYSCSCPPFECVCSSRVCSGQLVHPQSSWDGYWLGDTPAAHPLPQDTPEHYFEGNPATPLSYDFNICNDLFQPEEIFQLDQPLRTNDLTVPAEPTSKSPTTLLDLGSGTIHRSSLKTEPEPYWMLPGASMSLEDSNSSCRLPQCSPESLSQTPLEDNTACSITRPQYSPDYVQRVNLGFMNFHFEDKDNAYSKFQAEDQSRMFPYDEARYQNCAEPLMTPSLPGEEYPPCVPTQESRLPGPYHDPVPGPECYPRPSHFLPDQSNSSQEDPSLAYPQATPALHDSNFFQAFQYQNNNYFQHLPHH